LSVKLPGGGTGASTTATPCLPSTDYLANVLDNELSMSIMPQSTFRDLASLDPEDLYERAGAL
jgi:hypothetical protein